MPPASNTHPKMVITSSKAVCSKSFRLFMTVESVLKRGERAFFCFRVSKILLNNPTSRLIEAFASGCRVGQKQSMNPLLNPYLTALSVHLTLIFYCLTLGRFLFAGVIAFYFYYGVHPFCTTTFTGGDRRRISNISYIVNKKSHIFRKFFAMNFEMFKKMLSDKRLTLNSFAVKAGIPRSTVYSWDGRDVKNIGHRSAIECILGVKYEDLCVEAPSSTHKARDNPVIESPPMSCSDINNSILWPIIGKAAGGPWIEALVSGG